jgi:predicted AlkP superfamily pyrophosphatase or phosphodiesterase
MATNYFNGKQFIKPRYGSGCFADIPQFIEYLLLGTGPPVLQPPEFEQFPQRYKNVILLFIDAFGWRFFQKYGDDYPFLKRIVRDGVATKLTSQFPSTTAAHVTTINTNLPVGQHGVFEWQYYEPAVDAMITPLLFSFAGDKKRNTLRSAKIDPGQLLPTQTFHQELQQSGVASFIFSHQAYANSPYSEVITAGAERIAFNTIPETLVNIPLVLLNQQESPAYYYLYLDNIDAICHKYGPRSPQVEAEIDALLTILERWFQREVQGRLKNTLLIMTADHGQVEVDPETTIYLNLLPQFSRLQQFMRVNRTGDFLVPGGSCRDMFLYIKEPMLAEAQELLSKHLAGRAEVYQTSELIEQGFFGPPPVSSAFLARVGNLVILPYKHESVWWYQKGKFEQPYYGHHGGLTPEEAEIPLLLYAFPE